MRGSIEVRPVTCINLPTAKAALLYRVHGTYNSLMTTSGTQSSFLWIVIHEEPHCSGSHLTNSFLHSCNTNQTDTTQTYLSFLVMSGGHISSLAQVVTGVTSQLHFKMSNGPFLTELKYCLYSLWLKTFYFTNNKLHYLRLFCLLPDYIV